VDEVLSEEIYRSLFDLFLSLKRNFMAHHPRGEGDGLTRLRLGALGILSQMGALPTSELARLLRVSKPQATALVDSLVAGGLVNRGESKTDRRVVEISISGEGRAALKTALDELYEKLALRLERLGSEELAALRQSLSVLVPLLDKMQE
jgi:MarR family transcriptional regulator, organic hydroperoxide resistance regulator